MWWWRAWLSAGFPGNWWAHLMSIPPGPSPSSREQRLPLWPARHLPHTLGCRSRTWFRRVSPPLIEPLMAQSPSQEPFLWSWSWANTGLIGLWGEAQQLAEQPGHWGNSSEHRHFGKYGWGIGSCRGPCTHMWGLNIAGVILGWPFTCIWGTEVLGWFQKLWGNPAWPSTSMQEPGVDVPREFRELIENPKAVVGHSSGLATGFHMKEDHRG